MTTPFDTKAHQMGEDADVRQLRRQVDCFLLSNREDIRAKVLPCLSAIMHCRLDELGPNDSLVERVGAESIDFIEALFRLESVFEITIPVGGIKDLSRLGIEDEFEVDGYLSIRALRRLSILLPEASGLGPLENLKSHEIQNLFTSETFVRLVAWRLSDRKGEAGDSRAKASDA